MKLFASHYVFEFIIYELDYLCGLLSVSMRPFDDKEKADVSAS